MPACGERFADPCQGLGYERGRGKRAGAIEIGFDRHHHPARAQHRRLRPQHRRRITHIHQNKPPDDRVKRPVSRAVMDVAYQEPNVGQTTLRCPSNRPRDGIARLIDPHDLASRAHPLGGDEGHIPSA
jgi:hypothetical protein